MDHVNWEEVIRKTVPAKFLDLNLAAYQAGYDAVKR
jgi:Pyruvate/2-oxoacid:ferredoxin oxidoreductase gamma subunit